MAKESVQKKLGRVRAPRVHITYEVQAGDAIEKVELPFVVGVFADLSGSPEQPLPHISQRGFIEIDRDNINDVVRATAPRVVISVRNHFSDDGLERPVELSFESIQDFEPDRVARQIAPLRNLLDLRHSLSNLRSSLIGNDRLESMLQEILRDPELLNQVREEVLGCGSAPDASAGETLERRSILDRIVETGRFDSKSEGAGGFKLWLKDFFEESATDRVTPSHDVELAISNRIAALDELLSRQLDEVMHAEPLQKLEASWRGLDYLVQQSETSSSLKIEVFNVSKTELIKDFSRSGSFDESPLCQKIYGEEYGSARGKPFGVLIGDYEFSRSSQDMDLLEKLSGIAASSNAPFISAAAPALFNFESFTELAGPRDLVKIFDDTAYLRWNSFRKGDDSRYVGLCLPHVLMRLPYGRANTAVEEFDYEEKVGERDHSKYLWGNAAYVFAVRLTDAFARYGWCAAIRGVEGGGLVEGLPLDTFMTDDGDIATKSPTEIAITDRREAELARLGFIPLCYYKGTDMAVFMGASSVQKPQLYLDDEANANSRLSTQLPYIFACSRFAHFLKKAARDHKGTGMSSRECQTFLNQWISRYVLPDDVASQELRARSPLRDARVEVVEISGKPGAYNAIVFLRPHFQLDEMAVSLRLVVRLPLVDAEYAGPSRAMPHGTDQM